MNLTHEGVLPPDELDDRDERREEREIAQKRETLADIVRKKRSMAAEIRANLSNVPVRRDDQLLEADSLDREADRIEAALKRERESVTKCNGFGNAAAMREALLIVKRLFDGRIMFQSDIRKAHEAVDAALSAPPRQCDVGTPEEQQNRFNRFCRPCADDCPFLECRTIVECAIKWAQMPYEAQEGGAK